MASPGSREPAKLADTAARDGRIDRFYAAERLAETVAWYAQSDTGATDHQALMIIIDADATAVIKPRETAA